MAATCGKRVCVDVSHKRQLLVALQLYDEGEGQWHVGIKMHGTLKATTGLGLLVQVDAVHKSFIFQKGECFDIDDVVPPVYYVVLRGRIHEIRGVIFPSPEARPIDYHKSRDVAVQQIKCIADLNCESMEVEGGNTISTRYLHAVHHPNISVSMLEIAEQVAPKTPVKKAPVVKKVPAGLWHVLRMAQRKTGCSTSTIEVVAKHVEQWARHNGMIASSGDESSEDFEEEEETHIGADHNLKKNANAVVLQLHGCVGCNKHVFLPADHSLLCPKCKHPRFNARHKPNEVQTQPAPIPNPNPNP